MNAVTLYNDIWSGTSELEAHCKESLNPRGSDMLYELFARFSPTAQSEVIDIGCRDARYAIELANRFGCRVLGIDAGKQVKGRKRHILVDTLGLLIMVIVSSAALPDRDGAVQLFDATDGALPRLRRCGPIRATPVSW
jgi:hypothetical protein